MTWDLYRHLYDDDLDTVAERLEADRTNFLESRVQAASKGSNVVKIG